MSDPLPGAAPIPDRSRSSDVPFDVVMFASKDWNSHPQRPHWVARELARRGARVVFVENLGIRLPRAGEAGRVAAKLRHWAATSTLRRPQEVEARLLVDAPIVLPLQHLALVRRSAVRTLTRRLQRRIWADRPVIVWTYVPLPVVGDVAGALSADALVYDWVDDASAHALTRSAAHRRRLSKWEDEMSAQANVVFAASAELLRRRRPVNPRTFLIPHGTPDLVGRPAYADPLPHVTGPRIGFVGSVTEFTDLELVHTLARARPDWSFVLIGPSRVSVRALQRLPNVILTGYRPHEEVLRLLPTFSAAIVPYRLTAATEVASPIKVREYLAFGLPVVSVDVPDVRGLEGVEIASDVLGFRLALERAVARGPRRKGTAGTPWSRCVDDMIGHVMQSICAPKEKTCAVG